MSDTIIQVENLSKKYRLRHAQTERYTALRDVISDSAKQLRSRLLGPRKQQTIDKDDFWALKGVSFEVERGDRVGIIGRNGAGKSTLLKVLSRITDPTEGGISLHGRVASLLEVGTGFHPELTGRENIFLNGAILGMCRQEIRQKFDEIVSFAGVEKFLDTPVKRYSSGMYVRLAFAVAAHLEPEILIIDEVLAVGDAQFQKKCLGKMKEVGRDGRTVLFVSHNMGAVEALCGKCIFIENGKVKEFSSNVSDTIRNYIESTTWNSNPRGFEKKQTIKTDYFEITDFKILNDEGESFLFSKEEEINVNVHLNLLSRTPNLSIGYAIYHEDSDTCLWWSFHVDVVEHEINPGKNILRSVIPSALLNNGSYRIEILAGIHNQKWLLSPRSSSISARIEVQGGRVGSANLTSTRRPGLLLPVYGWDIEKL